MNKINVLQLRSIQAAKNQDWQTAVDWNQQILDVEPSNLGALNRLGVAYQQLGKTSEAQAQFEKVLELDKSNSIAKKQLEKIKTKVKSTVSFAREHFIEEPGTTKIVELHRLANKNVLEDLALGQSCSLKTKNRFISVETDDGYVGALPEDISFRLSKLIKTGNKYGCFIHSVNGTTCSVYLKETKRSTTNSNTNSFPTSKGNGTITDIDDRFLLEDDVPVNIVETDSDEEKTLDDVKTTVED